MFDEPVVEAPVVGAPAAGEDVEPGKPGEDAALGWPAGDGKPAPAFPPESAPGNDEGLPEELLVEEPLLPDDESDGIPGDPPLGVAQPAIRLQSKPGAKR